MKRLTDMVSGGLFLMKFLLYCAIIFAKTWGHPVSVLHNFMKGAYGEKRYNYRDIWSQCIQ